MPGSPLLRKPQSGSTLFNGQSITVNIPSAFQLLVRAGDYFAANSVIEDCPVDVFNSHGLRGWCAAVKGFLYPERAVEEFSEAANAFAADVYSDDIARRVGSWSSVNVDLWAKYFRARALVSQIVRTPEKGRELLKQAQVALEGTDSGWTNAQVKCFRFVLAVLDQFLSRDTDGSAESLRESFLSQMRFSGLDETDQLALQFFDGITAAFAELRGGPAAALMSGRLAATLDALGRIPLLSSDVASELRSQIGRQAEIELMGPVRTWIHRTLSSISDERVLQKVLLRLMQAELPLFVQLRHGVAEYGKDIVKLEPVSNRNILKMYQVKAGNIDMRKWRDSRNELEDMFYADLSDVQLPAKPDAYEGILIFNGHIHPLTEPLVKGWLEEQKRDHGRTFTIMGLDSIVTWIVDNRLTSELRQVLSELEISIVQLYSYTVRRRSAAPLDLYTAQFGTQHETKDKETKRHGLRAWRQAHVARVRDRHCCRPGAAQCRRALSMARVMAVTTRTHRKHIGQLYSSGSRSPCRHGYGRHGRWCPPNACPPARRGW
jgi:hypothetical protein